MRTDRLLAEIPYLLQHGRVTAWQLSEHFEVSPRTILRDMDALCMGGVPIISFEGAKGGFALAENYRLGKTASGPDQDTWILSALQAMSTVIQDEALLKAVDVYSRQPQGRQRLHVDLSVLAEDVRIQSHLTALRRAIESRHAVRILYTNASGEAAEHTVEPLELHYRWYAWYLHAYSQRKQAVLTYKLVRMDNVTETDEPIGTHEDLAPQKDDRPVMHIVLRCRESARVPLIEYLHARPQQRLENGDWLLETVLPAEERFWRGALLSLGNQAEILSPLELIDEFTALAQDVLTLYGKK